MADAEPLVRRAHALHVEYIQLLDDEEEEAAEALHVELDGVIARLEPLAADWPQAADAIVDLCVGHRLEMRTDLPDAEWLRLQNDSDEAYVDIGLELGLAHARPHFEWFRAKAAGYRRRRPRAVPTDVEERITREVRALKECIEALGAEPWRAGPAGSAPERRMNEAVESITSVVEWMDASERLVRLRRAARSVRRLRHVQLCATAAAWSSVRKAVAVLA